MYDWRITDLICVKSCDLCEASPPVIEDTPPPQFAKRLLQRFCYISLLAVIVLIRNAFSEGAVSLIGLLATIMWIPMIVITEDYQEVPIRREIFITATVYVVISVGVALLFNAFRAQHLFPASFEEWAGTMQTICSNILLICVGIAVLFLALCGLQRRVFSHILKGA